MANAIQLAAILTAWIVVAFRAVMIAKGARSPSSWWIIVAITLIAVSVTVAWPPLAWPIAPPETTGAAWIRLFQHITALAAKTAAVGFAAYATAPNTAARRIRTRSYFAGAAAIAMVITGTIAITSADPTVQGAYLLAPANVAVPGVTIYLVVFCAWLAQTVTDVGYLLMAYSRRAERRSTRIGLRFMSAGSVCVLLYAVHRAMQTVTATFEHKFGSDRLSFLLTILALFAWSIGVCIPGIARASRAIRQAVLNHRAHIVLTPMWRDLIQVLPHATALQHRRRTWFRKKALYKRALEMRDSLLMLLPWIPDHLTDSSATARAIRAGLIARLSDAEPPYPDRTGVKLMGGGDGDLDDDVAWLINVARSYATVLAIETRS